MIIFSYYFHMFKIYYRYQRIVLIYFSKILIIFYCYKIYEFLMVIIQINYLKKIKSLPTIFNYNYN